MKTLKEQLEEKMLISDFIYGPITQDSKYYDMPYRYSIRTMEEFCDINDIDIDNITEEQVEYFYENINRWGLPTRSGDYRNKSEWIRESLTSHNKDLLKKKLSEILMDQKHMILDNSEKGLKKGIIVIRVLRTCEILNINSLKNFKLSNNKLTEHIYTLLNKFNYYITSIDEVCDEDGNITNSIDIQIEPIYTEKANKDVEDNGNILYHVTRIDNIPDIMKKGLRPQVGKISSIYGGYRYFPERLFLVYHTKHILKDIKKIIEDKEYNPNEYKIIKINLKKHHIDTWYDDASSGEHNVYTMDSIPPKLIEIIKLEDIK